MNRLLLVFFLVVVASVSATGGSAQSGELPPVDPAACVIDPIELPPPGEDGDLNAATPTPTPIATEPSQPADAEVTAAVIERIAQSIACQNAGDLPRLLANFSPAWLLERFSGYDRVFLQRFMERSAAPEPLAEEDRIELVAIDDIRVRDDGVVVALVVTLQGEVEETSLLVLIPADEDWLIDASELVSAIVFD